MLKWNDGHGGGGGGVGTKGHTEECDDSFSPAWLRGRSNQLLHAGWRVKLEHVRRAVDLEGCKGQLCPVQGEDASRSSSREPRLLSCSDA